MHTYTCTHTHSCDTTVFDSAFYIVFQKEHTYLRMRCVVMGFYCVIKFYNSSTLGMQELNCGASDPGCTIGTVSIK